MQKDNIMYSQKQLCEIALFHKQLDILYCKEINDVYLSEIISFILKATKLRLKREIDYLYTLLDSKQISLF